MDELFASDKAAETTLVLATESMLELSLASKARLGVFTPWPPEPSIYAETSELMEFQVTTPPAFNVDVVGDFPSKISNRKLSRSPN